MKSPQKKILETGQTENQSQAEKNEMKILQRHLVIYTKIEPDILRIIEKINMVKITGDRDALYSLVMEKLVKSIGATTLTKVAVCELLKLEIARIMRENFEKVLYEQNAPNYIG